jgi:hypothetical protein
MGPWIAAIIAQTFFCEEIGIRMGKLIALLTAGLLSISVPVARAGMQISYSVNGGAAVVCAFVPGSSSPATCGPISAGPVSVSLIDAISNSPGTPGLGGGSDMHVNTSSVLTPVPEPVSIALLGGVILLISSLLIRRKHRPSPQQV